MTSKDAAPCKVALWRHIAARWRMVSFRGGALHHAKASLQRSTSLQLEAAYAGSAHCSASLQLGTDLHRIALQCSGSARPPLPAVVGTSTASCSLALPSLAHADLLRELCRSSAHAHLLPSPRPSLTVFVAFCFRFSRFHLMSRAPLRRDSAPRLPFRPTGGVPSLASARPDAAWRGSLLALFL